MIKTERNTNIADRTVNYECSENCFSQKPLRSNCERSPPPTYYYETTTTNNRNNKLHFNVIDKCGNVTSRDDLQLKNNFYEYASKSLTKIPETNSSKNESNDSGYCNSIEEEESERSLAPLQYPYNLEDEFSNKLRLNHQVTFLITIILLFLGIKDSIIF